MNKNTPQKGNRKPGDSPKNLRKKSKDPLNSFQWKRAGKTSLIWVLIIVAAIFLSNLFTEGSRKETEIDYFKYKEDLIDPHNFYTSPIHSFLSRFGIKVLYYYYAILEIK